MAKHEEARALTYILSVIMVLLGAFLISLGKSLDWREVLETIGTMMIGIGAVSLIYQTFIAGKHFDDFKMLLATELKTLDLIQSKCMRLGIDEIFETRTAYEAERPFMSIIEQSSENGRITCVARSLLYLLSKNDEFKQGLRKGLAFELFCIDPCSATDYEELSVLYKTDIISALRSLNHLLDWATKEKPKGSIELSYHRVNFPESALIFASEDGEKLVWDLSFGRDLAQKRVIILDTNRPLGRDLKSRYMTICKNATVQIRYSNGDITCNELGWEFDADSA